MKIIGIDCGKNGSSCCEISFPGAIEKVEYFSFFKYKSNEIASRILNISRDNPDFNLLLAVDTPFSWPKNIKVLKEHKVGEAILFDKEKIFKRKTDLFVEKKINGTVLSVGADRIARTSYNFYEIIMEVKKMTKFELNFITDLDAIIPGKINLIECYPRATLHSYKQVSQGYKGKSDNQLLNLEILKAFFTKHFPLASIQVSQIENDHQLDSLVCCVSAIDYLNGDTWTSGDSISSDDKINEGWIFFKKEVS